MTARLQFSQIVQKLEMANAACIRQKWRSL